jgi:hypothetical protein
MIADRNGNQTGDLTKNHVSGRMHKIVRKNFLWFLFFCSSIILFSRLYEEKTKELENIVDSHNKLKER